jgi:Uma2 family endonuclease
LTNEQKQKFLPLCPDFALELLSPSDKLSKTQDKMQEYLENGIKLGWLINSQNQQVEVYRQGREVEILNRPQNLLGENILPGFMLDLEAIW